MFLLMDADDELLPETLRGESVSRKPDFQGPEPDALTSIDRIFAAFNPEKQDALGYHPKESNYSWEQQDSILRAIGGATQKSITEHGKPLLDGLTVNLLKRQLFQDSCSDFAVKNQHSLFFDSRKKKFTAISVDEMLRYLNDPDCWKLLPFRGKTKEFEFSMRTLDHRRVKLVFTASYDDGDPWPTNELIEITAVRIGSRYNAPELVARLLEGDLSEILRDQKRRRELAEKFEAAHRAPGLKNTIRDIITRELKSVDIMPGDYSREGFSSGRFPYPHTRAGIKNEKWDLFFGRCEHCGAVKELTVDPHEDKTRYTDARIQLKRIEAVCGDLTSRHIAPWHDSVCPKAPYRNTISVQVSEDDWELSEDHGPKGMRINPWHRLIKETASKRERKLW